MESEGIKKRFVDLYNQSFRNNQFTFTSFLSMADISDFYELIRLPQSNELSLSGCAYKIWGGYENAERAIIRFGSEDELGYEMPFPICCIHISPLQKKFADDLGHRDFLGSLMNLGIERSQLGDILVKDKECYVFADESKAEVICRELTRVRHTTVLAEISQMDVKEFEPHLESATVQAKGTRIDSLVAKVYKLSRNDAAQLFSVSKVFVNGRIQQNESYQLKENDVVTVRGFGKLIYRGTSGNTRKGNLILNYDKYI